MLDAPSVALPGAGARAAEKPGAPVQQIHRRHLRVALPGRRVIGGFEQRPAEALRPAGLARTRPAWAPVTTTANTAATAETRPQPDGAPLPGRNSERDARHRQHHQAHQAVVDARDRLQAGNHSQQHGIAPASPATTRCRHSSASGMR